MGSAQSAGRQEAVSSAEALQPLSDSIFGAESWRQANVNAKLLMGLATVAFHKALLSEDPNLVREVAPHVEDMVGKMLAHGDKYTRGENFNRAVVLRLQLVAVSTAAVS